MKSLFTCFVAVLVTWKSSASITREWRRGTLIMLETRIVMSLLIFCLVLLMLRLISFMDLTITHVVLVHGRIALCPDTLVMAHILIMVIVPRVGMIFLLEVPILTLSRVALMVHAFPIVVHTPLAQMVRCKGL
jgi:hypothetical protein